MTEKDYREIEAGLNLSEDGTLKFHFVPFLKKLALAKVASLLWMSQSTQQDVVNLCHSGIRSKAIKFDDKWLQVKDNIVAKISQLCLPKTIPVMLKETVLALGNSILDWIQYHDRFTLKIYFKNCKYSAADLISHVSWTDRGKIDLAKTAKSILADQSLSDDQKYKIACTYCLKDEIAILASKVLNQDYLRSIDIDIYPMVYYWTTYIIGDNDINIHEYIKKLLTTYIQINPMLPDRVYMFIWSKLDEQEKAKSIASLVRFGMQDLLYSLLSNLDYGQQQNIFKKCSGLILCGILNDWLWVDYFLPVTLHVLEIMHPKCYASVLSAIACKMNKEQKFKDYFEILWRRSSRHLKDYIFDNEIALFLGFLFSWERDSDIIELIFKDTSNAQQRKEIILDEYCIEKCAEFIQNYEWNFLKLFMDYTLSSEEDIIAFKQTLIRLKGSEIAFNYLSDEEYDKIKTFVDWAFKSQEESNHFRQTLVRDAGIIMRSISKNPEVTLTKMENYFTWCANGDLELINKFKSEIPIHEPYLINGLIKAGQHQLLDQLLNWCYLGNELQIAQFKRNIADDDDDMHVDDNDMEE